MARKRASLKDKGMDALGPAPQTSRGIDVLFGESSEDQASTSKASTTPGPAISKKDSTQQPSKRLEKAKRKNLHSQEQENMPVNEKDDASLAAGARPAGAGETAAESLPVNEADTGLPDIVASGEAVDELGLPVALEAPPADLVPAVPTPAESSGNGMGVDTRGSAAAPGYSQPAVPAPGSLPVDEAADVNDLSGLGLEDDDLSGLMMESDVQPSPKSTAPAVKPPLTAAHETGRTAGPPPAPASPATVTPRQPVTPAPGAAGGTTTGPSFIKAPSAGAVPAGGAKPPAASRVSPPAASSASPTAASASSRPVASTASVSARPRSEVESFSGIVTEKIQITPQSISPEDVDQQPITNVISIEDKANDDEDSALAAKIIRYIGRERREKLDDEIEYLYSQVGKELSANKHDTEFALNTLRRAQNLVFEDPHEYDEALYLVATIRAMIARKRNIRRWSYTWGMFVFFYALVWLGLFVLGFIRSDLISYFLGVMFTDSNDTLKAVAAAWYSGLAGGIGGSIGILYSLYWHVAFKQDFDPQYIMYYLVQPVMGFFLGFVVYFIVASGFLLVNFAINSETTSSSEVLSATTVIAIQILLGFIAGFRQRFVLEMIDKIVQRISPRPPDVENESQEPVGVAPGYAPEPASARSMSVELKRGQGAARVEVDQVERQTEKRT